MMTLPSNRSRFQSTLSMRRATGVNVAPLSRMKFQSTLSMRRATHPPRLDVIRHAISIHALHEESDAMSQSRVIPSLEFQSTLSMRRATSSPIISDSSAIFQSTLSMRRATASLIRVNIARRISIHALHEESDWSISLPKQWWRHFNPRSP